jgi:hypothetical protein
VTEQDGFADTPGREATPEEEARVQALLASLRDDDVPMPDHVWSRLSAVIAEEHVAATARQITGTPTALGGSDDPASGSDAGVASVSVLPTPEQRARRGAPRWLLPAAAAAVVVLLAGGLVKGIGSGSSTSSAGGSVDAAQASSSPTQAASAESHSNFAYTQRNLGSQVGRLISRSALGTPAVPGTVGSGTDVTAGTAASSSAPTSSTESAPTNATETPLGIAATGKTAPNASGDVPPLLSGASLTACVAQLTGGTTTAAVAVDRGTYEGKPADIVVIPTENDPTTLDVWVLAPGCTADNADVLNFSRIARP